MSKCMRCINYELGDWEYPCNRCSMIMNGPFDEYKEVIEEPPISLETINDKLDKILDRLGTQGN